MTITEQWELWIKILCVIVFFMGIGGLVMFVRDLLSGKL